ncbi:pyruvate kinase [Nocardioides nematodiphilus]|uniref:pyruvate kinase n=1 Tax=Nocardioides nematodiphilus TaxID=2849669 RepID=UPI001CDA4A22|nr:pyruvate kinase [Nocardioides nematodiphilus]MCA1982532.1 pyruvate kinase [Nocardioides nematodiphilus]
MRRAKIVCTLGPAVDGEEKLSELIHAGMDIARLNMSHGGQADHAERYNAVRAASDKTGKAVGIFADLQGPKIRLEKFAEGKAVLERGQSWTITTRDVAGDATICGTTYKGLPGDVNVGDPILIDDGKVRLRVTGVENDTDVVTEVVIGGPVSNSKGINLPGVAVSVPALSEKDISDLRFALNLGVDMVALSFVRDAKDAEDVRAIMREEGRVVPIIAKIEKPQAVDNLDEVIEAFDMFMVARGDLGVECPLEEVPFLQKRIVEQARLNAKPVIVATQMLESMITNPQPTRAEANDVANAVLDGADAVMLSAETSVGEFPIHTVETMARIIAATEGHAFAAGGGVGHLSQIHWDPHTSSGVIAKAAEEVAERVGAKYLVAFTTTGDSARRLARLRGPIPLLAFTPFAPVRNRLALSWGIETFLTDEVEHTDMMVRQVDEVLLADGRIKEGELIVIIAGAPAGLPGSTNALRIHRMGDAINEVSPAYRKF